METQQLSRALDGLHTLVITTKAASCCENAILKTLEGPQNIPPISQPCRVSQQSHSN